MENISTLIEKQIRASLNSHNITVLEAATELASLVTDRSRKILIFQVGFDLLKNSFFDAISPDPNNDLREFMRIIKNGGQTEDIHSFHFDGPYRGPYRGQTEDLIEPYKEGQKFKVFQVEPYRADYDATGQDDPNDYPEKDEPQVMQG